MKEEIEKLIKRNMWKIVPKPKGVNIIKSKWVFHLKKDANRNVTSHQACLVAQDFTQVHRIDFDNTFTPITQMVSIRTVLVLTARYDWEIHQVDIKSAYLYGELNNNEVIYMKPPLGDIQICNDKQVLQLLKALYGLRDSISTKSFRKFSLISDSPDLNKTTPYSFDEKKAHSTPFFLLTLMISLLPPYPLCSSNQPKTDFRSIWRFMTWVKSTGCLVLKSSKTTNSTPSPYCNVCISTRSSLAMVLKMLSHYPSLSLPTLPCLKMTAPLLLPILAKWLDTLTAKLLDHSCMLLSEPDLISRLQLDKLLISLITPDLLTGKLSNASSAI